MDLARRCTAMVHFARRWYENARRWLFVMCILNSLFTCFSGPGALPIQMMTRGFCQAQLDKLHQIPEYLEVIEDDGEPLPIQPQQVTSQEEAPSKQKEGPPAKKTRSTTGKKSVLQQKTRTKVKEWLQANPAEAPGRSWAAAG